MRSCQALPLFENLVGGSTPPSPTSRKGGSHYVAQGWCWGSHIADNNKNQKSSLKTTSLKQVKAYTRNSSNFPWTVLTKKQSALGSNFCITRGKRFYRPISLQLWIVFWLMPLNPTQKSYSFNCSIELYGSWMNSLEAMTLHQLKPAIDKICLPWSF